MPFYWYILTELPGAAASRAAEARVDYEEEACLEDFLFTTPSLSHIHGALREVLRISTQICVIHVGRYPGSQGKT